MGWWADTEEKMRILAANDGPFTDADLAAIVEEPEQRNAIGALLLAAEDRGEIKLVGDNLFSDTRQWIGCAPCKSCGELVPPQEVVVDQTRWHDKCYREKFGYKAMKKLQDSAKE